MSSDMQAMGIASGRENFHFYRVAPRAVLLLFSPPCSHFDLKELKYIHDCFEPHFTSKCVEKLPINFKVVGS